jgi:hypothetical protein
MTTEKCVETTPNDIGPRAWFPTEIVLITLRSMVTIFRTPEALLPPIAISLFFLIIYDSTLGKAASFIPELGTNSYLGFILPLSIVSASLSGAGVAAQNLVRDLESGYFDKLLLTPIRRVIDRPYPLRRIDFRLTGNDSCTYWVNPWIETCYRVTRLDGGDRFIGTTGDRFRRLHRIGCVGEQ